MIYLINQREMHNKFYLIDQPTLQTVIITHGRLGTDGRKISSTHASSYRADVFVSQKMKSKIYGGYEKIDEKKFKKLHLQAAIVGSANKCLYVEWVGQVDQNDCKIRYLTDSELLDPDCDACLLVGMETRKKYANHQEQTDIAGYNKITILLTQDQSYLVEAVFPYGPYSKGARIAHLSVIPEDSELYKFVDKVGKAAIL